MDIHQTNSLTRILYQVRKMHHQAFQAMIRDKELYPGQHTVLFALMNKDGLSQKELANILNIRSSTMTIMLKRMERTGLIERCPDEIDQRVSRAYIKEKGRQCGSAAKQVLGSIESKCSENFTTEE